MFNDIKTAQNTLLNGGLILYPTDTIWGIGCDATKVEAISKIYALKKRTDSKSMLILLDTITRLDQYIQEIPEIARRPHRCHFQSLLIEGKKVFLTHGQTTFHAFFEKELQDVDT